MRPVEVRKIDQKRFDVLAAHSRSPAAAYVSEELAWFANEDETVLGVLLRDTVDDDYVGIVLTRDEGDRFRAFDLQVSIPTEGDATAWIERMIKWHTGMGLRDSPQGDLAKGPDLFRPILPPEKMHPLFIHLSNDSTFLPARSVIEQMMPHFTDVDGNFVEQFQSSGFDARLWELYLFAYLHEEGLFIDREHPAPDFLVTKYDTSVAIEAVIVGRREDNPAQYFRPGRLPRWPADLASAQEHLFPIRFGSPLFSKLKKRYWEQAHVTGKPLVFAIADFHDDQSMLWTSTALINYLYGVRHDFSYSDSGELVISPLRISTHKVGEKEIPSGYFFQPDAHHVSAVLFSASGTISKFNRIGRQAGFRAPNVFMLRQGTCHDHAPNAVMPKTFQYEVDESCSETWAEGLSMYHNPHAAIPVPEELFPNIAHHHFRDGHIASRIPAFHPYGSVTMNFRVTDKPGTGPR
jgi:hypothetical protein